MYEFEALLFSDPIKLAHTISNPQLSKNFEKIVAEFNSPEHINNSIQTAPSKRIIANYSNYNKVIDGSNIALSIGIMQMKKSCPLFATWVDTLMHL